MMPKRFRDRLAVTQDRTVWIANALDGPGHLEVRPASSFQAYFERISGTPLTSANAKITAGSHSVGSSPFSVAEGVWLNGTAQVSLSATHLSITVAVIPRLATPWNGRIYFDVLALH